MAFLRCLAYKAALYCRSKTVPVRMVWPSAIRYGRSSSAAAVNSYALGLRGH